MPCRLGGLKADSPEFIVKSISPLFVCNPVIRHMPLLYQPAPVPLTIEPPTRTRYSPLLLSDDIKPVLLEERPSILKSCCMATEFIINTRDGPYMPAGKMDTECLILSQYTSRAWDDKSFPLSSDWAACFPGLHFPHAGSRPAQVIEPVPWEQRISAVVFRGTATGYGHSARDNIRIRAAVMRSPILDIQLTGLNDKRLKVGSEGLGFVRTDVRFDKDAWMSMREQAQYKMQLILPGNVGAGRIGSALATGSCLLISQHDVPQCDIFWKMVPGVHYVSVAADLSNLEAVAESLIADDERCRRIGEAGRRLWEKELSRAGIIERAREVIWNLPTANDDDFYDSFDWTFFKCRSGVYCIMDTMSWELKAFVPFCNEQYRNRWPEQLRLAPGVSMRRLMDESGTLQDVSRWWQNANLICNQPVRGWQGDSQLPQVQSLLQNLG